MFLLEEISNIPKNFGYFLGSFDPIHEGHIKVVDLVLQEKLCDYVMIYCVNGLGNYKKRSDFTKRTKFCEQKFANYNNVIITYMNPLQIQKKLFGKDIKITSIIGSDVALNLETKNENEKIEELRQQRQKDYMRGLAVNNENYDSSVCASFLPASNVIIALRNNHQANEMPKKVCGLKVVAIVDTCEHRFKSSSSLRPNTFVNI